MNAALKYVLAVPIVLGLIASLAFGFNTLLDWRAGVAFSKLQLNDPEKRVRMFLGSPSSTEACGAQLWWNDEARGANDGRCERLVRYTYRHSSWTVGYSADHLVVSKHHEVSP